MSGKAKRRTAKEILAESFRELAENKSIDKIVIQEIVDNCGYSPATFYRNFKDKYDLIAWEHTRGVAKIMDRIDHAHTWEQAMTDAAQWYHAEKRYLANLFQHTSGHDAFIRYMTEISCDAVKKYILASGNIEELTRQEELYVRTYCLGTVSLTCEWILELHEATPEEIADIYVNAFPTPLQQYLHYTHSRNGLPFRE